MPVWLKNKLVADWKDCRRWWSFRIHALALGYMVIYAMMPTLDPSISAALPSPWQKPVIAAYSILSLVLRVIAQQKPNA